MRAESLRPGDVPVALYLALHPGETYESISDRLGISTSMAHKAVRRLEKARLLIPQKKRVIRDALLQFLEHGIRHAFYAEPGPPALGVPTAYSAPPLSELVESSEPVVWPSVDGSTRGLAVMPLYGHAPALLETSPELYRMLALVDGIRLGQVRERELAFGLLKDELNAQYHMAP